MKRKLHESRLVDLLRRKQPEWIEQYPKLIAREWKAQGKNSEYGIGDLVFANREKTRYLVVELKSLRQGSGKTTRLYRSRARKKCKDQAQKYGRLWAGMHPDCEVTACAFAYPEEPIFYGPFNAIKENGDICAKRATTTSRLTSCKNILRKEHNQRFSFRMISTLLVAGSIALSLLADLNKLLE